jgi:hypothetical protein
VIIGPMLIFFEVFQAFSNPSYHGFHSFVVSEVLFSVYRCIVSFTRRF